MTVAPPAPPTDEGLAPAPVVAAPAGPSRGRNLLIGAGRWVVAYGAALVIFGALAWMKGADPIALYRDMWASTFSNSTSLGEVGLKATPFLLAALAVAVPARAGLVNIGGEGQLVIGTVAAAGAGLALDGQLQGWAVMLVMGVAAAIGGGLWAGIAGVLRLKTGINEAISTLLLNYVATDVLLYLIYDPWKDAAGFGQPASRPLLDSSRLPRIEGFGRLHLGFVVAIGLAVGVWAILRYTSWGFRLRVAGGNAEAARRAGLPVGWLVLSSILVGGALAGLGGMLHFAGVEGQLRSGITFTFGYVGFLASWLARHDPLKIIGASILLGAIAVAGDSLQIDAGLPAATVKILMALVLLAVLANSRRTKGAAS